MKIRPLFALTIFAASPVFAEEMRQAGSHEHGVGKLDIAIEGTQVAMAFHAPGADIVGFEYVAESAGDVAKVEAALVTLSDPLALFTPPDAAKCATLEATAELEGEDGHDDHDDHGDEDHGDAVGHMEFHAEYLLECGDVSAVSEMLFAYFDVFPNAMEVEVQVIFGTDVTAFDVERDAPVLDLGGLN